MLPKICNVMDYVTKYTFLLCNLITVKYFIMIVKLPCKNIPIYIYIIWIRFVHLDVGLRQIWVFESMCEIQRLLLFLLILLINVDAAVLLRLCIKQASYIIPLTALHIDLCVCGLRNAFIWAQISMFGVGWSLFILNGLLMLFNVRVFMAMSSSSALVLHESAL